MTVTTGFLLRVLTISTICHPNVNGLGLGPKQAAEKATAMSHGHGDLAQDVYCPQEIVQHRKFGAFAFPRTLASPQGTLAYAHCPHSTIDSGARDFFYEPIKFKDDETFKVNGVGTRYCFSTGSYDQGEAAIWDGFRTRGCRPGAMDTVINSTQEIMSTPITTENVENFMTQLDTVAQNAPFDYRSAEVLVKAVNHGLRAIESFNESTSQLLAIRENMLLHLENYTANVKLENGQRVQVSTSEIAVECILFPEDNGNYSYTFESFEVPSEAVKMARGSQEVMAPRLQIMAYGNALFGYWGNIRNWGADNSSIAPENFDERTKWRIYDVQFSGVRISNLKTPIAYNFALNDLDDFRWICVFWNEEDGAWSKEGMKTIRRNGTVRCEATHLTAFSVLMDPIPSERPPDAPPTFHIHSHILSVLSSVGSAMSIIGLTLTVVVYSIIRRERTNQILLNMAIALLFLHIFSIFAGKQFWPGTCAVSASLLHYFLISSLSWMFIDAFFMYRLLITVFVQPESRFLLKRLLLGWGMPLGIVVLTVSIDPLMYAAGRDEHCVIAGHLNYPLFYVMYLGPCIMILLSNAVIFGRILYVLYQQNKKRQEVGLWSALKGQKPSLLSPIKVKGALTLFVVFGLGWTFGFGAIGPLELPVRYLHTILNAGQGMLLFVLRVVLDGKVSGAVRKSVWPESEWSGSSGTLGTDASGGHGPHCRRHDRRQSSRTSLSSAPAPQYLFTTADPIPVTKLGSVDSYENTAQCVTPTTEKRDALIKY